MVFGADERLLSGRSRRGAVWLSLACALACGACATIPRGRYGVDDLEIEGPTDLDPFALRSCLATKERPWLSIDLSKSPSPACGQAPFDASRIHVPLWRWPWTDWPLYDPGVFERDVARIERWYKARGYYDASVLDVRSSPENALYGAQSGENNQIRLRLRIEEGEPVSISSVAIDGIDGLEEDVGLSVLDQLNEIEPADRFDEALYDRTKEKLLRTLRDAGYAQAMVTGEVSIDPAEHAAEIRYRVESGPFSELGDICVEGYESLPAKLILQASDLRPGQPFSEQDLEDARTRIYQMRVFSEVEIITGRVDPETGAAQFQDTSVTRQGEWIAFGNDGESVSSDDDTQPTERTCRRSRGTSARPKVPVEIRVRPGKLYRFGVGTGIQIGVEEGQRAYAAAQQWDVHVFAYLELRNFLGGLRRLRIEERPKLVFLAPFPRSGNNDGQRGFELGNNLSLLLEWPAFLENRTLLRLTSAWDRGPDPFGGGFIRDDIDLGLGPSRDFIGNRLHASFSVHLNPYIPQDNGDPRIAAERYDLWFLQQILEWDERDDRTSPTRGTYARVEVHEALPPSSWGYVRVIPELRRYRLLPYGLVLATRVGLGIVQIYDSDAKTNELRRLGPRPYRLRGGGPYSVRGVQAGQLGMRDFDLEPFDPSRRGSPPKGFPGGTRSWIASVELRIPLGESFGIATFVDVGDVDAGYGNTVGQFRFDHPNTTFGAGLRYKTLVGPVRLDVGWLVPGLQGNTTDSALVNRRDPLFKVNGAVHLTIGEAF